MVVMQTGQQFTATCLCNMFSNQWFKAIGDFTDALTGATHIPLPTLNGGIFNQHLKFGLWYS
jgi:hypothetical protein|tara:strand:- start:339 stop:524 length:186 start_codon:yes stop_codon:yes gene_type:complete